MNINWVISEIDTTDPLIDIDSLKKLGSIWGSWRTWRSCQTDNVVCHNMKKASELLTQEFQNRCNFYIPNNLYTKLNFPNNVKVYEGKFEHDVDHQEDIVSMHLAGSLSDIVLMLGFDFSEISTNMDKLTEHRTINYRNLVRQAIVNTPGVQWVVVNHSDKFPKDFAELPNLGKDSLENILNSF